MTLTAARRDFPLLVGRPELIYLDSAAPARRSLRSCWRPWSGFKPATTPTSTAGAYELSTRATKAYEEARGKGVVDGAQSALHLPVRIGELGGDFFAFSGHKMGGPTGVGVLWGKYEVLEHLSPFLGGGEMISEVFLDRSTYAKPPQRFEAGTPAIAEAVVLGAAADYLGEIGMEKIWRHDRELVEYALNRLEAELPEVRTYGPRGPDRGGVVAFTLGSLHAHDIATALERYGLAVQASFLPLYHPRGGGPNRQGRRGSARDE